MKKGERKREEGKITSEKRYENDVIFVLILAMTFIFFVRSDLPEQIQI